MAHAHGLLDRVVITPIDVGRHPPLTIEAVRDPAGPPVVGALVVDHDRDQALEVLACGESHQWTMKDLPSDSLAEVDTSKLPLRFTLQCPERGGVSPDAGSGPDGELPVLPDLALVFESLREVDVYVPRSLGTLRHGNEPEG